MVGISICTVNRRFRCSEKEMMDEAGFSMLVDTTSEPRCMSAERSMCGQVKPVGPSIFAEWQLRVMGERVALNRRIDKLCDYMATEAYRALDEISRHLLGKQLEYMRDYAHILGMRIARFG
jgi:hypothetical protein